MYYSILKPHCSNFRTITAIFCDVQIFRTFTVKGKIMVLTSSPECWLNLSPHFLHSNTLAPVCTLRCVARPLFNLKLFPQNSQIWGLSSEWRLRVWVRKLFRLDDTWPQPCNYKESATYIESSMLVKSFSALFALEHLGTCVKVEVGRQHTLQLERFPTEFTNMRPIFGMTTACVGTQVVSAWWYMATSLQQ